MLPKLWKLHKLRLGENRFEDTEMNEKKTTVTSKNLLSASGTRRIRLFSVLSFTEAFPLYTLSFYFIIIYYLYPGLPESANRCSHSGPCIT